MRLQAILFLVAVPLLLSPRSAFSEAVSECREVPTRGGEVTVKVFPGKTLTVAFQERVKLIDAFGAVVAVARSQHGSFLLKRSRSAVVPGAAVELASGAVIALRLVVARREQEGESFLCVRRWDPAPAFTFRTWNLGIAGYRSGPRAEQWQKQDAGKKRYCFVYAVVGEPDWIETCSSTLAVCNRERKAREEQGFAVTRCRLKRNLKRVPKRHGA